ncbi:MAG: FtsQ-type POTRA domain-containing protein [Coriobacteriales bacterium]|jgi:cell division protein FtsQ|nr:FtsQ-type POTRA domain-containing protein [Coriobacteriales bacterium]
MASNFSQRFASSASNDRNARRREDERGGSDVLGNRRTRDAAQNTAQNTAQNGDKGNRRTRDAAQNTARGDRQTDQRLSSNTIPKRLSAHEIGKNSFGEVARRSPLQQSRAQTSHARTKQQQSSIRQTNTNGRTSQHNTSNSASRNTNAGAGRNSNAGASCNTNAGASRNRSANNLIKTTSKRVLDQDSLDYYDPLTGPAGALRGKVPATQGQGRALGEQSAANIKTVGDERKRIQRAKQRQLRKAARIRFYVIIGIVFALVVAAVAIYNSNLLQITQVKVAGATHLTSERLKDIAAVPEGSTLLRVDIGSIEARLRAEPWVSSASVRREFPSTLVLDIEERKIAAQVETIPDTASATIVHWLVSTDGIWLGSLEGSQGQTATVSAKEAESLKLIKDVSRALKPTVGAKVTDEGILNALEIVRQCSDETLTLIAAISAPNKTSTTLTLVNNVAVDFGAAENIKAKEQAIITLLNEHKGTITRINVRVPDRATYRVVEQ